MLCFSRCRVAALSELFVSTLRSFLYSTVNVRCARGFLLELFLLAAQQPLAPPAGGGIVLTPAPLAVGGVNLPANLPPAPPDVGAIRLAENLPPVPPVGGAAPPDGDEVRRAAKFLRTFPPVGEAAPSDFGGVHRAANLPRSASPDVGGVRLELRVVGHT